MMNIDQLVECGFRLEIRKIVYANDEIGKEVRLYSPTGVCHLGAGDTVAEATTEALGLMVMSLERYLTETESKLTSAECALHAEGKVVNWLDTDEVERMRQRCQTKEEN